MITTLIIDEETETCKSLEALLSKEGHVVTVANRGDTALSRIAETDFDIIFTAMTLPDMSGLDILTHVKNRKPSTRIIVITGQPSIEEAVDAIKLGAYDYIRKPLLPEKMKVIAKRAVETNALAAEIQHLRKEVSQYFGIDNIIGKSPRMMEIFKMIRQISGSDCNVIITGESGTGKELVARAIHYNSMRKDCRFVAVNCGAISKNLIEAELFGYVKGAFSGALKDKKGFLDLASGGTLFLDEIGETNPDFQVNLLRVIQEGEYNKVGDPYQTKVDVRVIAASNRDLKKALAEGLFREDLYYRLNVVSIHIPPLRERREDIPFLAQHFLEKYSKKRKDRKITEFSSSSLDMLTNYGYPGNVRELENAVEFAVTFAHGHRITPNDLPASFRDRKMKSSTVVNLKPYKTARNEFDRGLITTALKESGGNVSGAARLLEVQRQSLQQKIRTLGIKRGAFKSGKK